MATGLIKIKKNIYTTPTIIIQNGFTLIEVMIALVIISLMMTAFIKASGMRAVNLGYLENKTIALWIAQDVAQQIQSGHLVLPQNLDALNGERNIFNKNFEWIAKFKATEDKKTLDTDITVQLKHQKNILNHYDIFLTPVQNEPIT